MYRVAASVRHQTSRSFVFTAATAPKTFASSTEQKRPFWATTPPQSTPSGPFTTDASSSPPTAPAPPTAAAPPSSKPPRVRAPRGPPAISATDLASAVAMTHQLSKPKAKQIVNTVFDTISETLNKKLTVSIYGFGTFKTMTSKARKGRNPLTNEAIEIPEKNRIRFAAYTALKQSVQENAPAKKPRAAPKKGKKAKDPAPVA